MTRDPIDTKNAAAFSVPLPTRYLQVLRLMQALMESRFTISISEKERSRFEHLKKFFPLRFVVGVDAPALPGILFEHETPLTRIGNLTRPLIFPQATFDYCRALWPTQREVPFFFVGRIGAERHATLTEWSHRLYGSKALPIPRNDTLVARTRTRFRKLFAQPAVAAVVKAENSQLTCWASEEGRHFPLKAWHDEYYRRMARARFVLCPDGDFVWTYRFFEAIQCGAIPVVQNTCALYEGFRFHTMRDITADAQWSGEVARHNFDLARERLTVLPAELNAELESLITLSPK